MQLSEVSELRGIISLMRLNTCNSPRFHDRQDSEVDRIYNSSPKIASFEMRSSWLDRPSLQMQVQSQTSQETTTSPKQSKTTNTDKRVNNTNGKDKNGGPVNGKTQVIVHSDKKSQKGPHESTDDAHEKSFVFEREVVESIKSVQTSLLESALRSAGGTGFITPMSKNKAPIDSPVIQLTVYLPNREGMAIEVYEISTVEECIQTILTMHNLEGRQPPLYVGHPECYELRLHEGDGYPDEDIPALDRSRKIKNFGVSGNHEFCLCERPDMCPPVEGSPVPDNSKSTYGGYSADSASTTRRPTAQGDKGFLKIIMPNENYSVIPIKDDTTGKDLLPVLTKKHRLPMLDEYILKVSDADKIRLDLPSEIIDLNTYLKPLGLQEVTLARKVYADAPALPTAPTDLDTTAPELDPMANKNVRPPASTFMYNDVKAAMYKEWKVVKTNKYGKRQHRMLGIDSHKVYNSKVGERAIITKRNIQVAERPISSITWLRFLADPCDFQIHYSQPDEETIEYTASSAYECAEIVAKIKYIQEMNKRK